MIWSWLKPKLVAVGAVALAVLYAVFRIHTLKEKKKKLEDKVDTLEARHHIKVVGEQIKRKEKEKEKKALEQIKKEVDKPREDFSGIDSLSDPDNY